MHSLSPTSASLKTRTGARLLVDALKSYGVSKAFCVPGESYLPVLDCLYDEKDTIDLITCRQEGGAASMAEAYGKLTGKPGICFVTRGPGATNASIGVHTAFQDSTPMILFIGQVARDVIGREGFQEVDFCQMFQPLAKWAVEIYQAERVPEILSRAFHLSLSGRPGPVVISLPEDMLQEEARIDDFGIMPQPQSYPSPQNMSSFEHFLKFSKKPLMIIGGGGWCEQACKNIESFSENNSIPVATSFRCQDLFNNDHPNYVGDVGIAINPKLRDRIEESDLIIALGCRFGEIMTSNYSLFKNQNIIHIFPDSDELGRIYKADLMIPATVKHFSDALLHMKLETSSDWKKWIEEARQDYETFQIPNPTVEKVDLSQVVLHLKDILPSDSIMTNGAGNYAGWLHRFYRFRQFRTQLAPTSGAMGYGVPAAIAAKATYPDRVVVSFAGDGCFMMNGQELATAVQYKLNIIILVINNGMYGTIRMHQEKTFPDRVSGTDLINPDFVALAQSYGAYGELVEKTEDFKDAFERALKSNKPALLELKTNSTQITPSLTLDQLTS